MAHFKKAALGSVAALSVSTSLAHSPQLERKDTSGGGETVEVKKAMGDFLKAFETFKTKNDERLAQIEKKTEADPITEEETNKLNEEVGKSMDELKKQLMDAEMKQDGALQKMREVVGDQASAMEELKMALQRPDFVDDNNDGVDDRDQKSARLTLEQKNYNKAFLNFMRKGHEDGLRELEEKALNIGNDPDGGYLVGATIETMIDRLVSEVSPIRSIADVKSIGNPIYKVPYNAGGSTSGWVGEQDGRPQTETPRLRLREFPTMELYAMPAATQSLLDDGIINIEQWLADEVNIEFAEQEGAAFVNGDGVARPHGFMNQTFVRDDNWKDGKIGYIPSGAAAKITGDGLINLVYAPKSAFRQNGKFVMNRATQGEIRKIKDNEGNYLWQPGLQKGQPATLLGYGITEAEDMVDVAAGNYPVAFGDFKRSYVIVDRMGVRVLRDPFSAKPYVLFYTTKRVGGGVKNFEGYKVMKVAA